MMFFRHRRLHPLLAHRHLRRLDPPLQLCLSRSFCETRPVLLLLRHLFLVRNASIIARLLPDRVYDRALNDPDHCIRRVLEVLDGLSIKLDLGQIHHASPVPVATHEVHDVRRQSASTAHDGCTIALSVRISVLRPELAAPLRPQVLEPSVALY